MSAIASTILDRIIEVRRNLHQYPELSGRESETAKTIAQHLRNLGISCRQNVGGHGVVADLPGPEGIPAVALRADIDALPIHEETGLGFASQNPGVMHACGHDGHTSMLLGAAELLVGEIDRPAPVRLIFQPAEEIALGAKAMVRAGVMDGVGYVFGGHLDRHYPAGSIVVHAGAVNASSDSFRIVISGQGGHAGRPHETIDAVVVGALVITAIQTIVSREINPAHPSVVTVGRFEAGTAANVIAARAILEGSIRAQDPDVRHNLQESIKRIAEAAGHLHGAAVETDITPGTPPLINEQPMADIATKAAIDAVGAKNVLPMTAVNMGAEDFSHYLERVPGCYVRFGGAFANRDNHPAHSSRFDFDEQALGVGAAYYHVLALQAGQKLADGGRAP